MLDYFFLSFIFRIKPSRRPPNQQAAAPAAVAAKQNKYNIWSTGLQEECLTENLKVCGVDRESSNYDRNVESYDFKLKYRLNGENTMKRRQSTNNNSDDDDDDEDDTTSRKNFKCFGAKSETSNFKRFRMDCAMDEGGEKPRKNVRLRLGPRNTDESSSNSSNSGGSRQHRSQTRVILDLNVRSDSSNDDVARELANKLYEEKDELMREIFKFFSVSVRF